jgi:hypothetical protein
VDLRIIYYIVEIESGPRKSIPGPYHSVNTEINTEAKWVGGGGEMLTARVLTNISITQRNILTPD